MKDVETMLKILEEDNEKLIAWKKAAEDILSNEVIEMIQSNADKIILERKSEKATSNFHKTLDIIFEELRGEEISLRVSPLKKRIMSDKRIQTFADLKEALRNKEEFLKTAKHVGIHTYDIFVKILYEKGCIIPE